MADGYAVCSITNEYRQQSRIFRQQRFSLIFVFLAGFFALSRFSVRPVGRSMASAKGVAAIRGQDRTQTIRDRRGNGPSVKVFEGRRSADWAVAGRCPGNSACAAAVLDRREGGLLTQL